MKNSKFKFNHSEEKGICLVASKLIATGECISTGLAHRLSDLELVNVKPLDIYKFVFFDPKDYNTGQSVIPGYLAFGALTWCNHSSDPNAKVEWEYTKTKTLLRLVAVHDISVGDEITMTYANPEEYENFATWER